MKPRAEITSRYAKACVRAGKKDKGVMLDEVVAVAGWSPSVRVSPGRASFPMTL